MLERLSFPRPPPAHVTRAPAARDGVGLSGARTRAHLNSSDQVNRGSDLWAAQRTKLEATIMSIAVDSGPRPPVSFFQSVTDRSV